ncbi:hypothetical protein CPLU01_04051 [Colletotrichum plurivorum]|uniref:Transmembrane protein n=1 Tax=Colletotrichum plurivorum TaxID=2175906 RepID=A0A8H6KRG5_9PEZI|nr:hypothetical protein CPLU01_04051 [Colletotrichum plurivorum]
MLLFGFLSRVFKMSRSISRRFAVFRKKLRLYIISIVRGEGLFMRRTRRILGRHFYILFFARPLTVSWILGRLYLEFFSSFLTEVIWLSITTAWVLMQLLVFRSPSEDEGTWTFGQVAAVVLFAFPLLSLVEHWFSLKPCQNTRRNTMTLTHIHHLNPSAEAQARQQIPDNTPSEEEKRLVDATACWTLPSSQATVFVFAGFNLALTVFIFQGFMMSEDGVGDMLLFVAPWYTLYQPPLIFLVLLMGLEVEPRVDWVKCRVYRWIAAFLIFVVFCLLIAAIFFPMDGPRLLGMRYESRLSQWVIVFFSSMYGIYFLLYFQRTCLSKCYAICRQKVQMIEMSSMARR